MGYSSLRECVDDLHQAHLLVRIETEIDPHLEAAEIHRRVFQAGGPALYFSRVKGCSFPMVSNLFGTMERMRFMFRDGLNGIRALVDAKVQPLDLFRRVGHVLQLPGASLHLLPKLINQAPVLAHTTTLKQLPQLQSWPDDGGPFITLPQVYTEHPDRPGFRHSNLGMYRIQISGNDYVPNREVGLHYQIHRGIGVHHAAALRRGEKLPVHIFVGGPPAMTLAAVMPLPEGLPEVAFAGALNRSRMRMVRIPGSPAVHADADFCIRGYIEGTATKPEGPFGDHLGYYAKQHLFPMMQVESVTHRRDAIWPFTTVGRPPQEDTLFGKLIRELTGPLIPDVLPGVKAVHAVDETGVHPLLLAVGSERYTPYTPLRRPMEILTQAHAILGQGQMSLAKYLLIVAKEDDEFLDPQDIPALLKHLLERIDLETDLHFQTNTTIDTLDYSGTELNRGSKVIMAAAGPKRRQLPTELPNGMTLPNGFSHPRLALPGILTAQAPPCSDHRDDAAEAFCAAFSKGHPITKFPWIVLVDDSEFTARTLANFLWVTFTRSNPATDLTGIGAFVRDKAWGCTGSLVIDARRKPHHAPTLQEDPAVTKRVDSLAVRGGPLHGLW